MLEIKVLTFSFVILVTTEKLSIQYMPIKEKQCKGTNTPTLSKTPVMYPNNAVCWIQAENIKKLVQITR